MAFESLTERLNRAMKTITGQGKLTESNMDEMLREVRMSLLEADVNYQVVKDFVANVKEKALGQKVLDALNPGQMVVKIVKEELQQLLGNEDAKIHFNDNGITNIMMAGLQGTGKTTAAAKIARYLKNKKNKKVLLVACDVIRPAAIEQLQTLGESIQVPVFTLGAETSALDTAKAADQYAKENGFDTVIYDTAGRLHIDEELMNELSMMKDFLHPQEILLTVDAMTGQDIVTVAREFNEQLQITALIVTKLDGDARGGGLLSVRSITNVPVLFVSNGEKVDDLEEFHPDRMAERILGMGDILSLIEKAQENMDVELAASSMERMQSGQFDMNDLLSQFEQMNRLGSFKGILKMIPGMNKMAGMVDDDQMNAQIKRMRAIINSMTPKERARPDILKASRKNRIAKGAGVKVADVNKLLTSFDQMKMMSQMMSGGMPAMNPFGGGFGKPGGFGGPGGFGMSKHSGSKKKRKAPVKKKKRR
ncbi:signal recognition particle protein [Ileibacterium valens]|uniref:signal recognition particle protein n=1 Tax=Ileibacterium valens TaxID=1862668 RepID=UPI002355C31B|nr:signal recognition particle protein [Ileibacterium valens]